MASHDPESEVDNYMNMPKNTREGELQGKPQQSS